MVVKNSGARFRRSRRKLYPAKRIVLLNPGAVELLDMVGIFRLGAGGRRIGLAVLIGEREESIFQTMSSNGEVIGACVVKKMAGQRIRI